MIECATVMVSGLESRCVVLVSVLAHAMIESRGGSAKSGIRGTDDA